MDLRLCFERIIWMNSNEPVEKIKRYYLTLYSKASFAVEHVICQLTEKDDRFLSRYQIFSFIAKLSPKWYNFHVPALTMLPAPIASTSFFKWSPSHVNFSITNKVEELLEITTTKGWLNIWIKMHQSWGLNMPITKKLHTKRSFSCRELICSCLSFCEFKYAGLWHRSFADAFNALNV